LTTDCRTLTILQKKIIACERCPNLLRYCHKVAQQKRRMYRDQDYWGKPVPGFGDPAAELLILGLAPGAHGANRTGRMFTGDRSGDFLFRALHEAGFASQAESRHRDDGLKLQGCYITAALRCAPPANKPKPAELRNCQPYLERELELLHRVKAVLALGKIAFDTYLRLILRGSAQRQGKSPGGICRPPVKFPPISEFHFAHGASFVLPAGFPKLFVSYHPSQQNTQTGKLTPVMMQSVFSGIRRHLAGNVD
jgi:uracil-DNA glycosylase family 4